MIYGSKVRMPPNGASFLGIVLVMAGVACGDASNNPNGISTGGTSAGRGGGAGTAGRSGSGGSAPAGSAGAGGDSNDAGLAGTSGSSDASSPTGGGGSGGGRPQGCPEPNPIPVTGQTVVIQSINVNTSEMILRNATSTPQSIVLGRANWQWCAFPRYWSLSDEETTVELAPGETYSFIPVNNQSEVPELYPEEGEMAIYSTAQDFNDFETLESFVAWGDVQAYRESYAVQKGVWTFDERIEIASGDAGFIVTGQTDLASGYTSAPARCLVP
jgi:hypothetical protein